MENRIKKIRNFYNLSQEEFGEKIGVARNTIANYEIGNRTPKVITIKSISREFNVNYLWLTTGEGDMFDEKCSCETISDRITDLRVILKLTQEEFGNKLGVTKTAISRIEKGGRGLTGQMAKAISREYNVNYTWLTEGKGDMFNINPKSDLYELTKKYDLDDWDLKIIKKYLTLSKSQREAIKLYMQSILESE